MFRTMICLMVGLACAAPAHGDALNIRVVRDGSQRFHVEAQGRVAAPQVVVWNTLRDYDHLATFIPTLAESRRIIYQGAPAIEQVGRARFLFFHFDARAILRENADAHAGILTLRAVAGDFSLFESQWTLEAVNPRETAFRLRTEVRLKRWVPRWLERRQVAKAVRDSIEAVMQEARRRAQN